MVPSARKAALRIGLNECIARAALPLDCLPRLGRGDPRGNKLMAGGSPANPAALAAFPANTAIWAFCGLEIGQVACAEGPKEPYLGRIQPT
jgi:hypothetical protein